MIRLILLIVVIYFIYVAYRKYGNTEGISRPIKSSCPSPKIFMDYTEGRIKGNRKKAIDDHVAHCKDCQDAVKGVFGMSAESDHKQVLDKTKRRRG